MMWFLLLFALEVLLMQVGCEQLNLDISPLLIIGDRRIYGSQFCQIKYQDCRKKIGFYGARPSHRECTEKIERKYMCNPPPGTSRRSLPILDALGK